MPRPGCRELPQEAKAPGKDFRCSDVAAAILTLHTGASDRGTTKSELFGSPPAPS